MAGRGRPRRNPWDVMRMQRVYDLFCFEKGEHPITYYDMGKRLHKALTELGEAVSPHTCMAVARKMRKGLYARPGGAYIRALAMAYEGPAMDPEYPYLGEYLILTKLRAVRKGRKAEYLGYTYMERLFTCRDDEHPYFYYLMWLDDDDIAIDVAQMLGLDPTDESVTTIVEKVIRPCSEDIDGLPYGPYELIRQVLRDAGKKSDMVCAASSVIVVYLSLREKVFNVPFTTELMWKKKDGWLIMGQEGDFGV